MKKFIVKILIFSTVFFLFDRLFYIFLDLSPKQEVDKRLDYVINGNMNKDLIIIGSSRGARDLIAKQIEDSLNISCYNLSYPGSNIDFHLFLLKCLIKHNKNPKSIILVLDEITQLVPDKNMEFRFDRLYTLSKHDYINEELIKRKEKNLLSRFLFLSRINKSNLDIRKKKFTEKDSLWICGSMPINSKIKSNLNYKNERNYYLNNESDELIKDFLDFQEICTINKIQLFLVFPPNYNKINSLFKKRIIEFSKLSTKFIEYDISKFNKKSINYFYDQSHLNINGARIFTNDIIKKIKMNVIE